MRLFFGSYLRLLRVVVKTCTSTGSKLAPLTLRRVTFLAWFVPFVSLGQLLHWAGFLLDYVFFPGFRKVEVKEPLFVVGIPRSGTTFLQRLLTEDTDRFTTMTLGEIAVAPSITERVVWRALGRVDAALGGFGRRIAERLDKRLFREVSKIHPLSLFEPDEDELVMLPTFTSPNLAWVFPVESELWKYTNFDKDTPLEEQNQLIEFYKRCVQRHLYFHGPEKRYVAKNPTFSVKLNALRAVFPDMKVICTSRTPYEAVPSTFSLGDFYWRSFGNNGSDHPFLEPMTRLAGCYYRHPINVLPHWPEDCHAFMRYTDLVERPTLTVSALMERLGIELSEVHHECLCRRQEKARTWKSHHTYSMKHFGIDESFILQHFRDVLEYFDFPIHEDERREKRDKHEMHEMHEKKAKVTSRVDEAEATVA